MKKQHAQHGRDHMLQGQDPIFPDFEVFVSPDQHTPFTAFGTDVYTDGTVVFFVPPSVDNGYLVDAKAYVDTPTSTGNVEVAIWNRTQGKGGLSADGTTWSYLTITTGNRSGSLASDDGILTSLQYQEGDRVWLYTQTTDGVAMGLKVWLKFGPRAAFGSVTAPSD